MDSTAIIVIVLVLIVLVVLGVVLARRRRSTQLQEHFGPEYERSVDAASGDRKAAEAALAERQQRRQEFDVRDLRPEERSRFRDSWSEIQRGFVDDPRQSLRSADRLVGEVMRTRGYPVDDDFDRRAEDLSVDHPRVVQHYREARKIHDAGTDVDTEHQRTAITSYRSLVDALLGDEDDRHDDGRDRRNRDSADADVDDHADDRTPADHTGPSTTGRHALRDGEDGRGVGPADPNGPQSPRTEEHTR